MLPLRTLVLAAAAATTAFVPLAASAQSADHPPEAKPARTLKAPPRDSKVLGGAQRGTDAAGRGIDRADSAARQGIRNGAERASRPVRGVGEAFGRKLAPGSSGRAEPPPVGPQGNGP